MTVFLTNTQCQIKIITILFLSILSISNATASEFMEVPPTCTWISPYFDAKPFCTFRLNDKLRQKKSDSNYFNTKDDAESYIKENFILRTSEIQFHLPLQIGLDFINNFNSFCQEEIYRNGFYTDFVGALHIRGDPYYMSDTYLTLYITSQYKSTLEEEEELLSAISSTLDDILRGITDDEEKIKTIHDWIIEHNEYDLTYSNYRAYDAMISGTSVCQGYATLAHRMFQEANIPVEYVSGQATNSSGSLGDHAWNMVRLCGNWYHIDITWDDPIPDGNLRYAYYLLSDDEISVDHTWDYSDNPSAQTSYFSGSCDSSTDLEWQTSKETAFSMALSSEKNVLLLAGRETCSNTINMRDTVSELEVPNIKGVIEENYIPWYCDVDTSHEHDTYTSGISGGYTLPLICIIDPNYQNSSLTQTTGIQDKYEYYSALLENIYEEPECLPLFEPGYKVLDNDDTIEKAPVVTHSKTITLTTVESGTQLTFSDFDLDINFPCYPFPVDIYVALFTPKEELRFITSDGSETTDIIPIIIGTSKPVKLKASFAKAYLPVGEYQVCWVITQTNDGNLIEVDWSGNTILGTYSHFVE